MVRCSAFLLSCFRLLGKGARVESVARCWQRLLLHEFICFVWKCFVASWQRLLVHIFTYFVWKCFVAKKTRWMLLTHDQNLYPQGLTVQQVRAAADSRVKGSELPVSGSRFPGEGARVGSVARCWQRLLVHILIYFVWKCFARWMLLTHDQNLYPQGLTVPQVRAGTDGRVKGAWFGVCGLGFPEDAACV